MSDDTRWLRLSPDDVVLMWGVVSDHFDKATERWPRLERIMFDLNLMMREREKTDDR